MVKVRRSHDQWMELDQADSRLDWSRQEHMDHRDKRMAGAPCRGKHNQDLPGCRVRNQHCVTYKCGVCQIRTLYVPAVTATGGTRKATPLEHVQQGPPMPPPQTRRTKAAAATSSSSAAATKPTPRPTPAPAPRQTPATEQEEETPVHLPIWEPNGCQGQAAAPADGDEDDAETPGLTPASPNATQSPAEAEPAQAQDAAATSDVAANLPAGPGGAELPSPVNPPLVPSFEELSAQSVTLDRVQRYEEQQGI